MKKYNFNAGPSILPREVIENTAKQILDFNGSGLSLMEISHRAADFQPVVDEAVALIKELLDIHSKEEMERYTSTWSPYRSYATYLLWHYYLNKRNRKISY